MNEARLSPATRKLLEAAKTDAPAAAARERIWTGLSGVLGGTIGAATTTLSVLRGGASGTKVLSIGGLFGGTITVGLATLLMTLGPAPRVPQAKATAPSAMIQRALATPPQPDVVRESAIVSALDKKPSHGAAGATPAAKPSAPPRATKHRTVEDSLSREASLVSEARNALAHGNPELALRSIRAARALRSHQLVPEELAVEEQALRAIGHSDEANGIDVQLRLQYPESALAR
jgi:hypothetical protein